MHRTALAGACASILVALLMGGCSAPSADKPKAAAELAAAPTGSGLTAGAAAASQPAAGALPPASSSLVAPLRGTAAITYLKPRTTVRDDLIVTTIRVKNSSREPIAGLKVEEFWWSRGRAPVTGNSARLNSPLAPGETATLRLETPKVPGMFESNYRFSHAYGPVKATVADHLE
jgi:hypothetical protein